jgi:Caspase domain
MKPWLLSLSLSLACIALTQAQSNAIHFRQGKDYAIFFAVNNYDKYPDLTNPIKDAEQIATELQKNFGFTAEVVKNPNYAQIKAKLEEYKHNFAVNKDGKFPTDGQLFIFFSGHGELSYKIGYFAPSDADNQNIQQTGLLYSFLRNFIDDIHCNHILIAIDACFSGSFDERLSMRTDREFKRPGELTTEDRVLENHKRLKSRVFFTSDAVGDMTPDKSDFAKQFLAGFRTYNAQNSYMTSSQLFANYVKKAMPSPYGGEFGSDEAGSTFLFFYPLAPGLILPANDIDAWMVSKSQNTIQAYQAYLAKFPNAEFKNEATLAIEEIKDNTDWNLAKIKNTKSAFETYIRDHPDGQYVTDARQILSENLEAPICINLSANLELNTNGDATAIIRAADFIKQDIYSKYGQGPDTTLNEKKKITKYSINRVGEPVNSRTNALTFSCADGRGSSILVEVHAWDELVNNSTTLAQVELNDIKRVCK